MSSPPPTDWSFEPTDVAARDGHLIVVPWAATMDAVVTMELEDDVDDGAQLESVSATLWRLKAYGESDHTDVTAADPDPLPGAPVVEGTTISQRVANLTRGRVYRLYFTFGPAGNVRARSVVIDVSDNS